MISSDGWALQYRRVDESMIAIAISCIDIIPTKLAKTSPEQLVQCRAASSCHAFAIATFSSSLYFMGFTLIGVM